MDANARKELDKPARSRTWAALEQISKISCDFQAGGTPLNVMTCLHLDLTAFALLLGSCPNVPAKLASAHAFESKVMLCFAMIPLSAVPAR